MKESDLYPPLKAWLEANGRTVRAEVGGCDIAARKGDELVLIEMKRAINLDLLLQVVRRQRTHASVYAAVPYPKTMDKRWRALTNLLRRLEAGLLLVKLDGYLPGVEVAFHPVPCQRQRDKRATAALLAEMSGRSLDLNVGGTHRRALMTAYREQALAVAVALSRFAEASPKELRQCGAPAKAGPILLSNHYGWFERLGLGKYALSAAGREALSAHPELTEKIKNVMHEQCNKEKQSNTFMPEVQQSTGQERIKER